MQLFSNKKNIDMEHLLSPNATAKRICPGDCVASTHHAKCLK